MDRFPYLAEVFCHKRLRYGIAKIAEGILLFPV